VAGEPLRWARLFAGAGIISVAASAVSGQAGTADGVAALARGDYQRAVEILRPIAEDWRSNDAAAQFFLAGLYDAGHGMPADSLRACALYLRAASNHDDPFGRQAMTLLRPRNREFDHECHLLANIGFDHGFEPVTFDLGPGHSVEWTLRAVTVTFEGHSKREPIELAQSTARFLPLQHTELATGPTRAVTRHFIEAFLWEPSGRTGGWNLRWHLFEVVRDRIIRIDTPDSVLTVGGAQPPPLQTFDVRDYAIMRVDDDGNAEWAVLKGPRTVTERIESEAERRGVREADRARDVARARVDWSRPYDVHRQPSMNYVDADGCGLVHVHGWTADRNEAIVVGVRDPELGLSMQAATFDLTRDSVNISVEAHVYGAPQREFHFCSDVVMPRAPDEIGPQVWRAVAGTVSIELSPPGIRARNPSARRAIVTLTIVVLRNAAGTTVRVPRTVRLSATVGSMAG
jgi:hypothetical protein